MVLWIDFCLFFIFIVFLRIISIINHIWTFVLECFFNIMCERVSCVLWVMLHSAIRSTQSTIECCPDLVILYKVWFFRCLVLSMSPLKSGTFLTFNIFLNIKVRIKIHKFISQKLIFFSKFSWILQDMNKFLYWLLFDTGLICVLCVNWIIST